MRLWRHKGFYCLFCGRVGWLGWQTLTRTCCWLAVFCLTVRHGVCVRCGATRPTSGTRPPKALGFVVLSIRCPDPHFVEHIHGLGMGVKRLASLPRRLRWPRRLPDVVFSDAESIPLGADAAEYWGAWTTPHLFYCLGSDDSVHLVTDASSLQVWLAQVPAWWEVEFALRTEVPNSSAKVQFFCPVSRF